jgi:tryptophan-rich sensory protein
MPHTRTFQQALGLVGWLLFTFAAAAVGAIGSSDASTFYAQLARPGWAPPAWVFGPVWSLLYTLMGVAVWLIWRIRGMSARTALILFVGQLAANALWSWLFFAWHLGGLAFAEVVLLWLLIVATIISFRRTSSLAAALLLPYLAWVSLAAALTYATWKLNPGLL